MKLKSIHRQGVDKIVERLIKSGWSNIRTEEHFYMAKICQKTGKPVEGEIDVYATKTLSTGKRYLFCGEYKCNNKRPGMYNKAVIQLCKDYIHFRKRTKPHSTVSFFIYGTKPTFKRIKKSVLENVVWNYKF